MSTLSSQALQQISYSNHQALLMGHLLTSLERFSNHADSSSLLDRLGRAGLFYTELLYTTASLLALRDKQTILPGLPLQRGHLSFSNPHTHYFTPAGEPTQKLITESAALLAHLTILPDTPKISFSDIEYVTCIKALGEMADEHIELVKNAQPPNHSPQEQSNCLLLRNALEACAHTSRRRQNTPQQDPTPDTAKITCQKAIQINHFLTTLKQRDNIQQFSLATAMEKEVSRQVKKTVTTETQTTKDPAHTTKTHKQSHSILHKLAEVGDGELLRQVISRTTHHGNTTNEWYNHLKTCQNLWQAPTPSGQTTLSAFLAQQCTRGYKALSQLSAVYPYAEDNEQRYNKVWSSTFLTMYCCFFLLLAEAFPSWVILTAGFAIITTVWCIYATTDHDINDINKLLNASPPISLHTNRSKQLLSSMYHNHNMVPKNLDEVASMIIKHPDKMHDIANYCQHKHSTKNIFIASIGTLSTVATITVGALLATKIIPFSAIGGTASAVTILSILGIAGVIMIGTAICRLKIYKPSDDWSTGYQNILSAAKIYKESSHRIEDKHQFENSLKQSKILAPFMEKFYALMLHNTHNDNGRLTHLARGLFLAQSTFIPTTSTHTATSTAQAPINTPPIVDSQKAKDLAMNPYQLFYHAATPPAPADQITDTPTPSLRM